MSESKPEQQSSQQPNIEPTVLDYVLAKLMPWRGPAPEIPDQEMGAQMYSREESASSQLYQKPVVTTAQTWFTKIPWRTVGALPWGSQLAANEAV